MASSAAIILRSYLSRNRAERIEQVLDSRLKGITVLLEGPYDHGNIAAIMRTSEAFGVQSVHLVDLPSTYKPARKTGLGAQKWLTIRIHESIGQAVEHLRSRGYRLLAADLGASRALHELDFSLPSAFVFGGEKGGITGPLRDLCDETYKIPMVGQTQSLNVSCAAAITLFEATQGYRRALGRAGDLDQQERAEVRQLFYRRAVRFSDLMLPPPDTPLA